MCQEKTKRNRCIVSDWDTEKRRSAGCQVRSSTKCADKVHDKAVDSAGSEPQQICFVDRREGFGHRSSFARCCGRGPAGVRSRSYGTCVALQAGQPQQWGSLGKLYSNESSHMHPIPSVLVIDDNYSALNALTSLMTALGAET